MGMMSAIPRKAVAEEIKVKCEHFKKCRVDKKFSLDSLIRLCNEIIEEAESGY